MIVLVTELHWYDMLETSVTRWLTYRVIVTNPVNQQYSFKGGSVFTLLFSLALLVCNNGTDWYWLLSVGGPLLVVMLVLIWLVLDVLYIYIYMWCQYRGQHIQNIKTNSTLWKRRIISVSATAFLVLRCDHMTLSTRMEGMTRAAAKQVTTEQPIKKDKVKNVSEITK